MDSYSEFLKKLKNVSGPRVHKITNSYRTVDGINRYRKVKPKGSEFVVDKGVYLRIIKEMNLLIADSLIENKRFRLPSGLGYLEISKIENSTYIDADGNLKTSKSVDVDTTYRLWYEDEEARAKKTLVRFDNEYTFKLRYPSNRRLYKNHQYFSINFNRALKLKLKDAINKGGYDAFLINKEKIKYE